MRLFEVKVLPRSRSCSVKLHVHAGNADEAIVEVAEAVEGVGAIPDTYEVPGQERDWMVGNGHTDRNAYEAGEAVKVRDVVGGDVFVVRRDEVEVRGDELWIWLSDRFPVIVVMQEDENGVSTEEFVVLEGGRNGQ